MFKKFLIIIIVGVALGTASFYLTKKSDQQIQPIENTANVVEKAKELKQTVSLIPTLLGYDQPHTFLVLFLNNTEMRPGGGFIGSYALVRMDKRQITLFETNGSENLDWAAPDTFKVDPPDPIKKYLKQPRWFFRDANWSPDFAESAKQAVLFYKEEGGKEGDKIDTVVGITPTVIEKLLGFTGPITMKGKTFTAENFTDALEYHVEYGYKDTGADVAARKTIVGDIGKEFIKKITALPASKWLDLWSAFGQLTAQKQIMFYSNNADLQSLIEKNNWSGEMKKTDGDYLLVSDANLASLKTDPAIKKKITYQIIPDNNKLRAKVTVEYNHVGNFDWKTTRYRTYTRLYAPLGSQLISSDGFIDETKKAVPAIVSEELGKTVFGGFLSIEPQTKKTLTFEYYLPKNISDNALSGMYTLFVQKPLGSQAILLTVDLNFDKTVGGIEPKTYHNDTDLSLDRMFEIK